MAFIASNPEEYKGEVVGDGQCVAFVKEVSGAPQTSLWKEGEKVRDANIDTGTAIATFINGVYPSHSHGNHAAIYVSQNAEGLVVWDQWVGHPVSQRTIRFKGGVGDPVNDGDAFSVIKT
ncbi:MAG: BPSL0067 family protein [Proteobacteria bacterium]|nr:BPSL0067 family protein [Pseudomonadota bacterium]MBU4357241.1 BPSL0067 family protein [Pseudomonadota bacterium]MBU4448414.1 BPSL0067 family protein [Pseudomonadota bacterium]MCG2771834.1 BPSL0067 family protein [Desulfobacterales bacterium]